MAMPLILALVVAALLAALILAVWAGLRGLRRSLTPARLTDAPQRLPGDPVPQTVWLPAPNGSRLHALWLPAGSPAHPAPAAVLMHGWGGNGATLWAAARALHHAGFAVLLPDARNHGHSSASDHSSLPRFAQDLDTALDWVRAQPGVDGQRLCALGHSVGAAAVLLCASRRRDLAAVVSVSAFAHPEQVMRRWLATRHLPYWPLGWAINRWVEHVIGHRFNDIAPMHTIARVACPVWLVHGLQDDVVPLACAQQLMAHAPAGRVHLLAVPGTHEHFDNEPALLAQLVQDMLTAMAPGAAPPSAPATTPQPNPRAGATAQAAPNTPPRTGLATTP